MKPRHGFALAAALMGVVLIAVMVTAAVFATNQEANLTASEVLDQQLGGYAERGVVSAVSSWACPECDGLTPGGVLIRTPVPEPPFESTVYITALDSSLFLVTAEARITSASSFRVRRRVTIAVTTYRDTRGVIRASRLTNQSWSAAYPP